MQPHATKDPPQNQQQGALAIPEIVACILHEMDMRSLIAAQRVCRMWADLIHESRSLQQALFFLPEAPNIKPERPRVYNPLLAEEFPSFFPANNTSNNDNDDDAKSSGSIEYTTLTSLAFAKDSTKQQIYLRPEASWRRMLTTQPPIHTIGQFSSGTSMMGMAWTQEKATPQKDGLRMATLFETMVSMGRYTWNSASVSVSFGGVSPVNAHWEYLKPCSYMDSDTVNAAWAKMLRETDLLLVTSDGGTCTDPEGPDDPGWVKSDCELVWEGICECYEELGLTLAELPMEMYNRGMEGWN